MQEADNSVANETRWRQFLGAAVSLNVRYLLAGLLMGGFWALSKGPLLNQAVGLLLAIAVLPPMIHVARSRRAAHREQSHGPRVSLTRLTLGKASVMGTALAATWLLGPTTSYARPAVGLALTATVATLGPLLHSRMLVRRPDAAQPE